MDNIFTYMNKIDKEKTAPLAYRMRPQNLNDYIGQSHILGNNKPLKKLIEADKFSSIILYGKSGTGKTSLAKIIANMTEANFIKINATTSSKSDLVKVISQSSDIASLYQKNTIVFIDEIHRFNKAQQDYLLPFVEDGTIRLIGATTENPYFEVNPALISRSVVFTLNNLSYDESYELILRAINFLEREDGINIKIEEDAKKMLIRYSAGDARSLLQYIEILISTKENDIIVKSDVEAFLNSATSGYSTDDHYDTISAFIKSIRGSDPDASLYYLARMLDAGEDIKFICRRLMILASEDVGNADPMALILATNASLAVERVGFYEGRIILSQITTYLACAPKSNSSYTAIERAMEIVKNNRYDIPNYLKDAHYKGAEDLDRGIGYKYPHNYTDGYIEQRYLPKEIENEKIYNPKKIGFENEIINNLKKIRGIKDEA